MRRDTRILRRSHSYGKEMKAIQLGYIENGTGKHQSNTVWYVRGICPCISTLIKGGTQQIKVLVNGSNSNRTDG